MELHHCTCFENTRKFCTALNLLYFKDYMCSHVHNPAPFFSLPHKQVVSPGPAYDVSGSLTKKQFNKQIKSGATFGTGRRFMPASRNDGPGPGKYNGREVMRVCVNG